MNLLQVRTESGWLRPIELPKRWCRALDEIDFHRRRASRLRRDFTATWPEIASLPPPRPHLHERTRGRSLGWWSLQHFGWIRPAPWIATRREALAPGRRASRVPAGGRRRAGRSCH